MQSLKSNTAIVGIGGCGNNIALVFEKMGYKAIHINSSEQDEAALVGAKTVYHLKGFNGTAGDRQKAMEAIALNQDLIQNIADLKEDIIFIAFGAGGGTGSGISPTLAGILAEETGKTICCIVALPSYSEDLTFHTNSYACVKEIATQQIGGTIFLDNNKEDKISLINTKIARVLDSFLDNSSVSQFGNVDEEEKRTMLRTAGSLYVIASEGDITKICEDITNKNIYAPLQGDKACQYIAIINSGNKALDKDKLVQIFGMPERTFTGYGNDKENIVVAAGLSFPLEHVKKLGDIAKTKNAERKEKDTNLDDLNLVTSKKETTEEKAKKKLSSRELLMKYVK